MTEKKAEFNLPELTELQNIILSNRISSNPEAYLNPQFKDIQKPISLETNNQDLSKALDIIHKAINKKKRIGLYCDYDVDGSTSTAMFFNVLTTYLKHQNIKVFIPNRFKGYGIHDEMIESINKANIDLLITGDLGISESENIKKINCPVVVTDHHIVPEDGCQNAYAVINPYLSEYDNNICGCAVTWLLSCALTKKDLIDDLDYVGLATIADMVSLTSITNRFFAREGIKVINKAKRPCWDVLPKVDDNYIGFMLAPRINSDSRINGKNENALKYLITRSYPDAQKYSDLLVKINEERKKLQKIDINKYEPDNIIFDFKKEYNEGVIGLIANNLADKFGTALVMTDGDDKIVGSSRSKGRIHLQNALQEFNKEYPDVFIKFGGHASAAGFTVHKTKFNLFKNKIKDHLNKYIDNSEIIEYYDYNMSNEITLDTLKEIDDLSPYGQGFKRPLFRGQFKLTKPKTMGKEKAHMNMLLNDMKGVRFFSLDDEEYLMSMEDKKVDIIYEASINDFRGKNVQLIIRDIIK